MKTSMVILTHNQLTYTIQCIESIRTYTTSSYEIIVIDNGSTDGSVEWLQQQKDIQLIVNGQNLGFPKGCNQGIEIATGDTILLLNNDVIVTRNWLDNLLTALYSEEKVGAVGPVTNYASYYSTVHAPYTNFHGLHAFAAANNQSDPTRWDRRVKLIGFCMLIKRSAIDEIGILDEIFTPGNYEDDDFSLRLIKNGYKLLLCRDSFIHHYGSVSFGKNNIDFSMVLHVNAHKFQHKWGFHSDKLAIEQELAHMLAVGENDKPRILHIGCGVGATLLDVRNRYPSAILSGVEESGSTAAAQLATEAGTIHVGDISDILYGFPESFFDCVVLASTKQLGNLSTLLGGVRHLLKNKGQLVLKFSNITYHGVFEQLLTSGEFTTLDRSYYSLIEVNTILQAYGYELKNIFRGADAVGPEQEATINRLLSQNDKITRESYETVYYLMDLAIRKEQ